jgi:hypothetical protein
VLLTCDNAGRAAQLRSFADETRTVSMVETTATANPQGKPREPSRTLKLSFSESYPSPPNTVEWLIPLQGDDLDLEHAHLPAGMHATAWRR